MLNNIFKKFESIFLFMTVIMSMICLNNSFSVWAATNSSNYGDYQYTNIKDEISITKYTGNDSAITVPSTIEGHLVTKIENSAFNIFLSKAFD